MRTLMRLYINRSFFRNTFKAIQLSVLLHILTDTFNDNNITSLFSFILIIKSIIHFIINKTFEFIFIIKLFEITKLYQNFISNLFALLTKVVFIKSYKPRNFKKVITNSYRKMH